MLKRTLRIALGTALGFAVLPLAATGQTPPAVPATLEGGGRLRIDSAYLRVGDDPAVVRGMVRRDALWRGPVGGHLHVIAYDAAGRQLALVPALWARGEGGGHSSAMPYLAKLGVPRDQVARLAVVWRPGRHADEAAP